MRTTKFIFLASLCAGLMGRGFASPLAIDYGASTVDVAVKSTVHDFTGHLETYTAEVDAPSSNNLPAKANLSFDFADLKTSNTNRDADMLKWLDHNSYPKATFHLTGWETNGGTNLAVGNLTIHGVTTAVKMPTTVTQTPVGWEITGHTDLDYRSFGLTKIRKAMILTVDPHLRVRFHLVGKATNSK